MNFDVAFHGTHEAGTDTVDRKNGKEKEESGAAILGNNGKETNVIKGHKLKGNTVLRG